MSERADSLQDKPVVIVGMGPGGLVAALELARKEGGPKVLILEKREHFTRGQKVALSLENIKYLRKIFDEDKEGDEKDAAFIQELEEGQGIVEIYKIQEYLRKQLEKYRKKHPEKIDIKQGRHIEVKKVGLVENGLEYIENGETRTVQFEHLIAADGAGHATATMAGLGDDQFVSNESQPRQEVHGAVTVELLEGTTPRRKIKDLDFSDLQSLAALRWDKPYLPRVYIWPDKTGKFYIAGEVPDFCLTLNEKAKQEVLETWAKIILEKTYGYSKDEVGLNLYEGSDQKEKEKNKLKTTAFSVTLKHAVASAYDCNLEKPGEHAFIQIGDASRSANFFTGRGANDAMEDGVAVAEGIESTIKNGNVFNVKKFNQRHQEVLHEVSQRTQLISQQDRSSYPQLTVDHKIQLDGLINDVEKNILPYVENKKKRREINKRMKRIKSLAQKNEYGAALVEAEKVFDEVHTMLVSDTERFSKSLPELKAENEKKVNKFCENISTWFSSFGGALTKQELKVSKDESEKRNPTTEERKTPASQADKKEEKEIKSKLGLLYQFRGTAESLATLAKLGALRRGKRLPEAKPGTKKPGL